jgi:phospholipase C
MFNGGNWEQWLPSKTTTCMAHMERSDLPFHHALADAVAVCDAYHCSMLGPTDPNRYYMWTGWDGNDGKNGGPVIANDELGYGWQTYPERLQAAGISWKIYQDIGEGLDQAGVWGFTADPYIGNYGDNSLLYFFNYQNAAPNSRCISMPAPEPMSTPGAASSTSWLPMWPTTSCPACRGSSLPRRTPSIRRGPPATAPGTPLGCSTR